MGVYTDYFQKSKVFLYPLLKLRKGLPFVPKETYVAWDNVYSVEDCRFFCKYKAKYTNKFQKFVSDYLYTSPYFEDYIALDKNMHLFIFDFGVIKSDYNRFIAGKYSQFSGVDLETLETVYEICTSPDLEKETLIDNNLIIQQLLKRSSISLTNK